MPKTRSSKEQTLIEASKNRMNAKLFAAIKTSNPIVMMIAVGDLKPGDLHGFSNDFDGMLAQSSNGNVDFILTLLDQGNLLDFYLQEKNDTDHVDHVIAVNALLMMAIDAPPGGYVLRSSYEILQSAINANSFALQKHLLGQSHVENPDDVSIHCNPKVKALIEGYLLNKMANHAIAEVEPVSAKNNRARI